MAMKKKLLSMKAMEPIAKEATRQALSEWPEPPKKDQENWTLGKFETDTDGIFEIYIPSDTPLNAKVITRATVNRQTGEVSVEVFLDHLYKPNHP